MNPMTKTAPATLLLAAAAASLLPVWPGPPISVTSDPPGAVVYANDVELGRTPLEASFTYYGGYDVRVEKEGFEPYRAQTDAVAPFYEYPPFDLIAVMLPWTIEPTTRWNFKL